MNNLQEAYVKAQALQYKLMREADEAEKKSICTEEYIKG